jgi:hypothetical protein
MQRGKMLNQGISDARFPEKRRVTCHGGYSAVIAVQSSTAHRVQAGAYQPLQDVLELDAPDLSFIPSRLFCPAGAVKLVFQLQ